MDAERLVQIEEIYHAVLEIPESERDSFFKEQCGEDESLRREVESLLVYEQTFHKFIDLPPESLAAEMFSERANKTSLINKTIRHYNIKKLLGKGGMGEVYLAFDTKLKRQVALKILPEQFTVNPKNLNRFIQEAIAASALNHPNIITIYEIGEFESINFIATEFIDGETLRDYLTKGTPSLSELISIAVQIAEALSAAHTAGIIHRDIKPENIMIRRDGYLKILDFGLAKLTENRNSEFEPEAKTRKLALTMPGSVMGTASYMSPEQTRGLADIDARSDIWSLGVVIFEMLTGRTPFSGDTVNDVIASILKTAAPHLSKIIADCPPELDRIVTKSLQKDREERYQVIKDLALDLKSLRKELEFSAEFHRETYDAEKNLTAKIPKITNTTVAETGKRFSTLQFLSTLLAAVLILSGVWWYFVKSGQQTEPTDLSSLKTVEIVNWSSTPGEIYSVGSFSPDAKMIAFASTKSGTGNIWIKQTASGEAIQITKDEFGNKQPIWSPNGEEIAFYSTRGNQPGIWRVPKLGGSPKLISPIDSGSVRLRFWSKNDQIFYESGNELFAVDVNSGETKQITELKSKNIKGTSPNLSLDEQSIVYISVEDKNWSLWLADLKGKTPQKLFGGLNQIKNVVWHPDNLRVFFSSQIDGTLQIFVTDIYASQPRQITFVASDSLVLDVSKDGSKILFGSAKEESDIWGVNIKNSKESNIASDIDSELWPDVSPDGKFIAYQAISYLSQGNKLFNGNILTKNITANEQTSEIASNGFLPKWSPDGKTLAFLRLSGDKFQIETIKPLGGEQKAVTKEGVSPINNTVLPYNRFQTSDYSWSPDSQKIAYISDRSGQNNIWIVNADGSNVVQLTNDETNLNFQCPLWSSDGKRIAYTTKTNNTEGKPTYGIWVINTETTKNDPISSGNTFIRLIGWSLDGKHLILASTERGQSSGLPVEVRLIQTEVGTGKMSEILKLNETYLFNIHLSFDKRTIAFAAHREGKDNIWIMPVAGGEAKQITGNDDSRLYFSSLAWSLDNNNIFFGKQSRYSLLSMLINFK